MIRSEAEARDYVANLCDVEAMERLDVLTRELRSENEAQNLIARATMDVLWQRHIADSAQLLDHTHEAGSGEWLDLGSGAGFPGLVIAAMRPEKRVVLVESRRRRIDWLERCAKAMGLTNCEVAGSRLEVVESFPASVISARAFAPLDKLLKLSGRFSTSDTIWVLPKGRSAAQEVAELPRKRRDMFHVEQSQTDGEAGIIVGHGQWSVPA